MNNAFSGMVFPDESPAMMPVPAAAPAVKVVWSSPLEAVENMVIKDQAGLTAADVLRQEILADVRKIEAVFDPQIAKANDLHKSLLAQKKELIGPRTAALDFLKPKIAAYIEEQDRIRLQKEREAELKNQEAKKLQEAAVDKAWELVDQGKPGEAEAQLREAGDKAGEIRSAAEPAPPKPRANVTLRELWDFEVVDAAKLPREYLVPDLIAIGKVVRATKDQTKIPGVRVIRRTTVANKASRG